MKNIFLTLVIVLSATLFVKADFFPVPGSFCNYVDNGTGLDVAVGIAWASNTGEFADGFVVSINGSDIILDFGATGAWGDPGSAFFGTPPSGNGTIPFSPLTFSVTIAYPAGWMPGDVLVVLIDGYGDAFGDDPTGANSFYIDEPVQGFEAPAVVEVTCGIGEPEGFYSTEASGLGAIPSSTNDDNNQPLGLVVADDFNVGAGGLSLNGVFAVGGFTTNTANITDVTVVIYTDAGGFPGPPICSFTETPLSASGVFLGDMSIQFSSPCALTMGTYWISVEVNANAQWIWDATVTVQGAEAHIFDTNGIFGLTDWTPLTQLGLPNPIDMAFTLYSCEEEPVLVPTLSQWGLIALALLLMVFGAIKIALPSVKNSLVLKQAK